MEALIPRRHPVSEAVSRLRAQKAFSTDPDYIERMVREEEARVSADRLTAQRHLLDFLRFRSSHPFSSSIAEPGS